MRKLVITALIALIGAVPMMAAPVLAQTQAASPTDTRTRGPLYPILVGLGAIGGVTIYNIATYGVTGVPGLAPAVTTGAMITARAVAENRLYTVVSAVSGAWVVNWLYGN